MGTNTPFDPSCSSVAVCVEWIKQTLPVSNLDDAVLQSLFHHLADLEIFSALEDDNWKICLGGASAGNNTLQHEFLDQLNKISGSDEGFILSYFLGDTRPLSQTLPPSSDEMPKAQDKTPEKNSSNLSNLQIVKKVGRQLQPFIELENKVVSRLQGKHTSKADAQRIFHFVLSKEKAQPKKWEQLSRKRHK